MNKGQIQSSVIFEKSTRCWFLRNLFITTQTTAGRHMNSTQFIVTLILGIIFSSHYGTIHIVVLRCLIGVTKLSGTYNVILISVNCRLFLSSCKIGCYDGM